jgi:hypothetical protein
MPGTLRALAYAANALCKSAWQFRRTATLRRARPASNLQRAAHCTADLIAKTLVFSCSRTLDWKKCLAFYAKSDAALQPSKSYRNRLIDNPLGDWHAKNAWHFVRGICASPACAGGGAGCRNILDCRQLMTP